MEEAHSCSLTEVADVLLGDSILVMGTNPTEGKALMLLITILLPFFVCKSSIVSLIAADTHTICLSYLLSELRLVIR